MNEVDGNFSFQFLRWRKLFFVVFEFFFVVMILGESRSLEKLSGTKLEIRLAMLRTIFAIEPQGTLLLR